MQHALSKQHIVDVFVWVQPTTAATQPPWWPSAYSLGQRTPDRFNLGRAV